MTSPHQTPAQANILALASFIASHPELPFDMAEALQPMSCGTAGCIGGFAAALWPSECQTIEPNGEASFDVTAVGHMLGITKPACSRLLFPGDIFADTGTAVRYQLITRLGACQTLTRLAATGTVQWHLHEQLPDSAKSPVTSHQPEVSP